MITNPTGHGGKILAMISSKYPVEMHKKAFLPWASGVPLERLSRIPSFPDLATLKLWRKGKLTCKCGWHKWDELKTKLSKEEIEEELRKEGIDVGAYLAQAVSQETEDALSKFIMEHGRELRPLFQRIKRVFGVNTNGRLTGNLHVDMLITGYLLVLKVRESIVKIEINDAYQLIQLMRTLVQLFKEWNLPSEPIKVEDEFVEIKLVDADRPTPWKEAFQTVPGDESEEWDSEQN